MLYAHAQEKEPFFFDLGNAIPLLVCPETLLPVRLDSKEPIAPQQLQSPEPTKREKAVYAQRKLEYDSALTRFRTAQELQ